MIDFEVFDESTISKNKVCRLRLVKNGSDVDLEVVDEKGIRLPQGSLLRFNLDGIIHCYPGVNEDLGFNLDGEGRVCMS